MRGRSTTKPSGTAARTAALFSKNNNKSSTMATNRNRSYKNSKHSARRQALLGKIHIGRKQLDMDEDTYRDMMKNIGRVKSASSKDLTPAGIDRVLQHMQRAGAIFTSPKRAGRRPHSIGSASDRAAQISKIEALLADAGRPYEYAVSMARRMYKKDALEFCDGRELAGIIAALAKNAQREGR
jgi:phage gp16-like protein